MFKNKTLLVLSASILSLGFFAQNVSAVVVLDSILITSPATKLEYFLDQPLDISGLVVTGNYTEDLNTFTTPVAITTDNITGFDSSVVTSLQVLTVTVDTKTTTYPISVVAPTLTSIEITTLPKVTYTVGEALDISGIVVTGTYNNDSTPTVVISGPVSGFDSSVVTSLQVLTVTVDTKTATYTVDIIAAPVVSRSGTSGSRRSSGASSGAVLGSQTGPSVDTEGQVLGASTYVFNSDLSLGMSGDAVKELQERLRAEGFFTFPTSTGYFGPITLAAVKAYQTAHPEIGYVTGYVGPLTRAILNK
jgi:peptidoglycan hydrolase-like protein with peptidoglycan-binding domain